MDFIKSNKGLIIGVLIGVFIAGMVFIVSTQTGLFDEDEKLFNEISENVDEDGNVIEEEDEKEEVEQVEGTPEDIESFVDLPQSESIAEGTEDDGSMGTVEAEATHLWEMHDLMPVDGDSSAERDLKKEARVSTYEDYTSLKEQGMDSIKESKRINLGRVGISSNEDYIYKNNEVVELGDIKVVGANINSTFTGISLSIQNESGELIDMDELQENVQIRFSEDVGMGTNWIGLGELAVEHTDIDRYNSEGVELTKYLGRNLVKNVTLPVSDGDLFLARVLDSGDNLTDDVYLKGVGDIADEFIHGDNYDGVVNYQGGLPEQVNFEIQYKDNVVDYSLLKSYEEMGYNYEEEAQ